METTSSSKSRRSLGETERQAFFLTGSYDERDALGGRAAVTSGLQEAAANRKPRKAGVKLSGANLKPRRSVSTTRRRSSGGGRGTSSDFTFAPYAPMMLDAWSLSPRHRRASAPGGPSSKKARPSPPKMKTKEVEKLSPTLEQCLVLPFGLDPPSIDGAFASSRARSQSEGPDSVGAQRATTFDDDRAIISGYGYDYCNGDGDDTLSQTPELVEQAAGEEAEGIVEENSRGENHVDAVVYGFPATLDPADVIDAEDAGGAGKSIVQADASKTNVDPAESMQVEDVVGQPIVRHTLEGEDKALEDAEEATGVDVFGELEPKSITETRPLSADADASCAAMRGVSEAGSEVEETIVETVGIAEARQLGANADVSCEAMGGASEAGSEMVEAVVETVSIAESRQLVVDADADDSCDVMRGVSEAGSEVEEAVVEMVTPVEDVDSVASRKNSNRGGFTMVEDDVSDVVVTGARREGGPLLESLEQILEWSGPAPLFLSEESKGTSVSTELESDSWARDQVDTEQDFSGARNEYPQVEATGWLEKHDDGGCVPCAADTFATVIPTDDDAGVPMGRGFLNSEAEVVLSVEEGCYPAYEDSWGIAPQRFNAKKLEVLEMEHRESGDSGEDVAEHGHQKEEPDEKELHITGEESEPKKVVGSQQPMETLSSVEKGFYPADEDSRAPALHEFNAEELEAHEVENRESGDTGKDVTEHGHQQGEPNEEELQATGEESEPEKVEGSQQPMEETLSDEGGCYLADEDSRAVATREVNGEKIEAHEVEHRESGGAGEEVAEHGHQKEEPGEKELHATDEESEPEKVGDSQQLMEAVSSVEGGCYPADEDSRAVATREVNGEELDMYKVEHRESGDAGKYIAEYGHQQGKPDEEELQATGEESEPEKVQGSQQPMEETSSDEGGCLVNKALRLVVAQEFEAEEHEVQEIEHENAGGAGGKVEDYGNREEEPEEGQGKEDDEMLEARGGGDGLERKEYEKGSQQPIDVEGEEGLGKEDVEERPCVDLAVLPANNDVDAEPAGGDMIIETGDDALSSPLSSPSEELTAEAEEATLQADCGDTNVDDILQSSSSGGCGCVMDWQALAREMEEEWVLDGSFNEVVTDPEGQREIEVEMSPRVALKTTMIEIKASDLDSVRSATPHRKEIDEYVENGREAAKMKTAEGTECGDSPAAYYPPVAAAGVETPDAMGGDRVSGGSKVSIRGGGAFVGASSRDSYSDSKSGNHSAFMTSPIRPSQHHDVMEGVSLGVELHKSLNADGVAALGVEARTRGVGAHFVSGGVSPVQQGMSSGTRDGVNAEEGESKRSARSMDRESKPQGLGERAESKCECCVVM